MSRFTHFVPFVLIILLIPALIMAQGRIKGKVTDEAGEPIPFANILIEGTFMGAAADVNGEYTIENVPAGRYTLKASAVGYKPATVEVTVSEGETIVQNFTLTSDVLRLEEVVVTGTYLPRRKMESSVAISTLAPREIEMAVPRSTTEMLRYVPGFTRVESSGGEVNQNISVRGIFGVEYVMFMEDGLPVYPTMHTFFMNADNLFRPDENIERIEIVRGGNASLFGSNTPGAIINFINKTGGPELRGVLKATMGTKGYARFDFNLNGPLGERWRFNIGGFYRYDHGVRDPGFPGIRGGQLKANVTRLLDNGYIRLSVKFINDRNQFILPLPFQNPDDPDYVPGFSDYGAMNTIEGVRLRVPLPKGNGELELPLDDGIRTNAYWLTADVSFDFPGGWNVQNTVQVMGNKEGWNAIVPYDVMRAEDWATQTIEDLKKKGVIPENAQNIRYNLWFTNHFDAKGNKLPFNTPNGLLAPGGEWHVEKPMSHFQNQLQIRKQIGEHRISVGAYFAHYTQINRWYFTEILTDVRDQPRFVDMTVTYRSPFTGQDTTIEVTKNGFRRFLSLYANGSGQTTIFSLVGGAEIKPMDRLRVDIGLRYEYDNFAQVSENTSNIDLDGDPKTVYDIENWGNGTFRQFNFSFNEWAASIGLNYSLNENLSIYAQGSRAFKMPALDEYIFPAVEQAKLFKPRHTYMAEAGVKFSSPMLGLSANGFWAEIRDIFGQGAESDPETGETRWVILTEPKIRSYGAEIELKAKLIQGLEVLGAAIFLKGEFGSGADIGSWLAGVPPAIINLAGIYSISGISFKVDWHYVGRRWVSVKDNVKLNAYNYFNIGVAYRLKSQGVTLLLDILNANQSKGFEEGNPRLRAVAGRTSNLFLARPILPRRIMFSIRYDF